MEYAKQLLQQDRVRLIGVCYGHQIIGRAMGTEVGRSDKGWEISVSLVKLTQKGEELFGKDMLVSLACPTRCISLIRFVQSLHQMHRDVVQSYPPNVEHLGSSPRCDVQGMYVKNRLITVQGHPEFNEQIVRELLETRHEQGVFDDELYQEAVGRVANHHDGVVVGAAFIKFLLDD